MVTYLILGHYSRQGVGTLDFLPTTEEAVEHFRMRNVELKAFYLTLGTYDLAALVEVPDERAMIKLVAQIGLQGIVSTETLRAFTPEEFREVLAPT